MTQIDPMCLWLGMMKRHTKPEECVPECRRLPPVGTKLYKTFEPDGINIRLRTTHHYTVVAHVPCEDFEGRTVMRAELETTGWVEGGWSQ